jgi:hypothetical protein
MSLSSRIKLVIPLVLLALSLLIYLGHVQPLARSNEQRFNELADSSSALLTFVHDQQLYPSTAIVEEMTRVEADLRQALDRLLSPLPEGETYEDTPETLFEEWGFAPDDAVFAKVDHFRKKLLERAGPEAARAATNLVRGLALSICRTGVTEFEKLDLSLLDDATASPADSLRALDGEIAFLAGATESLDFIEDWIFNTGGGFLIKPESARIQRKNPEQLHGDLTLFSSPPVLVELRVTIYLIIDKG